MTKKERIFCMRKTSFWTPPRLVLLGIALLLLVGSAAAFLCDTVVQEESLAYVGRHKTGVGQLTDQPVTQTFTVPRDGLTAVEVMVSNYNKKLHEGSLTLSVLDSAGQTVGTQRFDVSALKNNAFVTLPVSAEKSAGQTYTLSAVSDCTEAKGVTLRMGPRQSDLPGGVLTLADGTQDTENFLNLRIQCATTHHTWQGAYILGALGLFCLLCLPLTGKERAHAQS